MSEVQENNLTAYLGPDFQQRLMWQLLVEPEFAEKILQDLAIEYFDDPNLKRLFIIILEYFKEYGKVPNLQNRSIQQAIAQFKTPNNIIEEESLGGVLKRIEMWNERIINKQMLNDGDTVQKATNFFVKQQEYRKLAEDIIVKVKNGSIKKKNEVHSIEEKFQKIQHIGEEPEDSEDVTDGIDKALRKEFRETIPTGIGVIDSLTGGGLGKGEIGLILTPSGVGKTTLLTVIANTAYGEAKNVAQIIFEDTKDQIKRKHYTIWSKSALSKLDEDVENERVKAIVHARAEELKQRGGRLIIKRFSQENTTMMDIRNWMRAYEKKYGFKFDILILDYLDCLESHKKSDDRNEAELTIVKSFEALAADFNIPAWSAIQSNRSGFNAEFVDVQQTGGNIKRVQKAHFFMSVAKTQEQKEASLANIQILKARFAHDGQKFTDCIFNNDTMQIIITDPKYPIKTSLKHFDSEDIDKLTSQASKMNAAVGSHYNENNIISKLNDDNINGLTVGDVAKMTPQEATKLLFQNSTSFDEKPIQPIIQEKPVEPVSVEPMSVVSPQDTIIELDESHDIEKTEGIIEGANEGAIDGAKEGILDFSGDTATEIVNEVPEVHMDDIPKPVVESKPSPELMPIFKPEAGLIVEKPVEKPQTEVKKSEDTGLIDPDAPQGNEKFVRDMLTKMRVNQNVMKT